MRYDINILWIDDSQNWKSEQQENLELLIYKYGLLTNFDYIQDANLIEGKLLNESSGFKIYDIIFVDYNMNTINGIDVINVLRKSEIDADILFYSAYSEFDIQNLLEENNSTFDGIYLADKDNFSDMALKLYKKNIRSFLSMLNMRGFLADKTSENDFIMHSYISQTFNALTEQQKDDFFEEAKTKIKSYAKERNEKEVEIAKTIKNQNVNQLLKLPSYILPLKYKYELFEYLISNETVSIFNDNAISKYLKEIITMRNNVSHKKLDICEKQKFIKYYDNITQYENRKCPNDCEEHSDSNKISVDDWMKLIKLTNKYSQIFDGLLNELLLADQVEKENEKEPALV